MGMFDHVVCQYPLPDLPEEGKEWMFQTKDMECNLWTYTITRSGHLIYDHTRLESIPEEEQQPKSGNNRFPALLREVLIEKDAQSPYTGFMEFGYYRSARPDRAEIEINYLAYFDNGMLQGVQVCEDYVPDHVKEEMLARIQKNAIEHAIETPDRTRTKKI